MSNSTEKPIKSNIRIGWESPSNIALIKYWGKYGKQLPRNPSVSFTLHTAATRTFVTWSPDKNLEQPEVTLLFEGSQKESFRLRMANFIESVTDKYFPSLRQGHIQIETSNSFPHSSGIASSASAMSAIALCLCDLENTIAGNPTFDDVFYRKASYIARLGSGSACRSVYPLMAVWGQDSSVNESSEEWAVGIGAEIHPVFHTFHDDILIISPNEKSVPSTAGHQLMENSPYAPARYNQASQRLSQLLTALRDGDIETFGKITEDEALTLHALMMCSDPSYILMEEGSLSVINKIRKFRKDTGIPIWFTLDAGPNVHVLYPAESESSVMPFIINELKPHCHEGRIIRDRVGMGPEKLC
jgi:diphosphomevalonate decarboxylase